MHSDETEVRQATDGGLRAFPPRHKLPLSVPQVERGLLIIINNLANLTYVIYELNNNWELLHGKLGCK